ncbi:MAG: hypothetical protein WCA00_08270 [Candidatus Acidiferrales bacterium]
MMHVTSHISNSQADLSTHEMPIWSRCDAEFRAGACAKPRSVSGFVAAVFRPPAVVAAHPWRTEVRRYKVKTARPQKLFRNVSNPTEVQNEKLQY